MLVSISIAFRRNENVFDYSREGRVPSKIRVIGGSEIECENFSYL